MTPPIPPCGAALHPHHGEAASGKLDEGEEVSCGFLTAKRDTFEALEFTDSLLNACTGF